MMWILKMLITSFFLTVVIEWIVGWFWHIREKSDWYVLFLANLITNPVLVMIQIWGRYFLERKILLLIMLVFECLAWMAEGLIYSKKLKTCRHPYGLAVSANMVSYGCGLLFSRLI